ncbi:MAG: type II toxin-antitoxin system RelE/ParE family toxin [Oscillospiraceae bacterium]|nr:type II toxin-antitoxin system RelE/ParE family toxin [Oscillospiraceae bacterium]
MYQVNTTETAERDLLDTAIYIAQTLSNKAAANRLLDKVDTATKSLSQNPMRQPLVKDEFLAAKGLRLLPINNYLLFYVVRDKTNCVNIIRFIHSRREWTNLFDETIFENIISE